METKVSVTPEDGELINELIDSFRAYVVAMNALIILDGISGNHKLTCLDESHQKGLRLYSKLKSRWPETSLTVD